MCRPVATIVIVVVVVVVVIVVVTPMTVINWPTCLPFVLIPNLSFLLEQEPETRRATPDMKPQVWDHARCKTRCNQ